MYIAAADPENAVDTNFTQEYVAKLMDAMEHSEEDRKELAETLAYYMLTLKDQYSKDKLVRLLMARANEIVERPE